MRDETDGSFGATLRRRREAAGLSQEELASRAGLSAAAISALERGERKRPYPHTIRALAAALELDWAALSALAATNAATRGARAAPPPDAAAPLPAPLTPLIGREAEVAALAARLAEGARLITLTGPGGVGKTRLALAAATVAASAFPGGASFIPLAPLADPTLLLPTIAAALDLHQGDPDTLGATLVAALSARRPLLVLDNCEHLLPAAAPPIAALLAGCPDLAILATSRATLRVQGELEQPVAPLPIPAPDRAPSAAHVASAPAARLFLAQASAVAPDFTLTDANAASVAAICRRLDGLPLALELAAAWIKLLPPNALLARLDHALPLLAGGSRDLPARQRTLRDTIAWSHDLLDQAEQTLFRRLAPFAGGWTLEAAAAVARDSGTPESPQDLTTLEGLAALLDKNLIFRLPAPGDDEAEPRYGMLETIRAYALELLAREPRPEDTRHGEETRVRDRHAGYFLALAERAEPELFRSEQRTWFDRLDRDWDNLRAALDWSLSRGLFAQTARIAAALEQFWTVRGPVAEGRRWLERALEAAPVLDPRTEARSLQALAGLDIAQAQLADAAARSAKALRLARSAGDRATEAMALSVLGYAAAVLDGDLAESRALLEASAAISRDLGQDWFAGSALFGLALATLRCGDLASTAALLPQAQALLREHGSWWYLAGCLITEAHLALARGEGARAAALCREAIVVAQRAGDTVALPHFLVALAGAQAQQGHAARAARLFGAAETLLAQHGTTIDVMANRDDHERHVALARAELDADTFAAAWATGRGLSLEQLLAEALAEDI